MEAGLLSLSVAQRRQFWVYMALNPAAHLRWCQVNEHQNTSRCPDRDN